MLIKRFVSVVFGVCIVCVVNAQLATGSYVNNLRNELVKTWRSFIGVFVENELRARTVLNVIRLLNGNRNIHDFSYEELVGEDPDADLDEFFMDKDQQREEWYY